MPHVLNRFGSFDIEAGTSAETLSTPLVALGFEVEVGAQTSGCGLSGGADPRREGVALGE
jgi:gamma-glutamyltranspeptidase/glutathione hydrolase